MIQLIVGLSILVLLGVVFYFFIGLVKLISLKKERVNYFTKKSLRVILLLTFISIAIQFLFFRAKYFTFDGYHSTDIYIQYNDSRFKIEESKEKDRILEMLGDRKINRILFGDGSSNTKDTIYIDFVMFNNNDTRPVHLIIQADAIRVYESGNTSFIYRFDKDELDLYEKALELVKEYKDNK